MLRKLKQQVTQAVNGTTLHEPQCELLAEEEQIETSTEGFLCPTCMHSFATPNDLQAHFEVHTANEVVKEQSSLSTSSFTNGTVDSSSSELRDLLFQIEDEKRYSSELKKELENLNAVVANRSKMAEGEVPYLIQQVQMLEAGKSLVAQHMLELEKKASAQNRQYEQLKYENEVLQRRSNELASALSNKLSELEEKEQVVRDLKKKSSFYEEELLKNETKLAAFEEELRQRPSDDDVDELKKGLVHAQHLMDKRTENKEAEIRKHLDTIRELNVNRQEQLCIIENLNARVAELEANIDELKNEMSLKEKAVSEAETRIATFQMEHKKTEDRLLQAEEGLKCNGSSLERALSELEDFKKQTNDLIERNEKLASENSRLEKSLEEEKKKRTETETKFHEKYVALSMAFDITEHPNDKVEKMDASWKKATDIDLAIRERLAAVGSLAQSLIDEEEAEVAEERVIEGLKVDFSELRSQYEKANDEKNQDVLREKEAELAKSVVEIHALKNTCEKNEQQKSELEKSSSQKISAAEAEIETLKSEQSEMRKVLNEKEAKIDHMLEEIREASSSLEKEKTAREKDVAEMKCKLESLIKKSNEALTSKEKDVNEAYERLEANRVEAAREKKNYERRILELNESLQQSRNEVEMARKEACDLSVTIDELNENLSIKSAELAEKVKTEELLRNELQKKEDEKTWLQESESSLRKQIDELNKEIISRDALTSQLKEDYENNLIEVKQHLDKCREESQKTVSDLKQMCEIEKSKLENALTELRKHENNAEKVKSELEKALVYKVELEGVRKDFEKTKSDLLKEKQLLQEKCLTTESDLEFERERAAVNKRRFEDILSAMQDLGRANQTLQMDISKHANRKWLDDSEAVDCSSCHQRFTLTMRKHHCRRCGMIFCASCSSHTAKVPSCKNAVRVCNNCYEEIMH